MFIAAGKHSRRRRLGRAAEWCPHCRDACAFTFFDIRTWWHIYFIPISPSKHESYVGRCERCRNYLAMDPRAYPPLVGDRKATIEDLVDATNPDLPEQIAGWLDLREDVRAGVADERDRLRFLLTLAQRYEDEVQKRAALTQLDVWSCLTLPLAIVVTAAALVAGAALTAGSGWGMVVGFLLGGAVGFTPVIVGVRSDAKRFARRRVRRRLVREWVDAGAVPADAPAIVGRMHDRDWLLGRFLEADRLAQWLERRMARVSAGDEAR